MSVDHYLLAITDAELESILDVPQRIRNLVKVRDDDVRFLDSDGLAIIALTAKGKDDPLAFMSDGAPPAVSDWVGKYVEEKGRVVTCEVDMGYGPATYYRNNFVVEVARKLQPWTVEVFAQHCDMDWLEENYVYPQGWRDEHRKGMLIEAFRTYRACIIEAAEAGHHLLVWTA